MLAAALLALCELVVSVAVCLLSIAVSLSTSWAVKLSMFWVVPVGNVVAFFVAMIAIKTFIGYLTKHGFRVFGYYRIVAGVIILLLWKMGYFDGVNVGDF